MFSHSFSYYTLLLEFLSSNGEQTLSKIPFGIVTFAFTGKFLVMGLFFWLLLPPPSFLPSFLSHMNIISGPFILDVKSLRVPNPFGISADWPMKYPVEGWILDQYSRKRSEIDFKIYETFLSEKNTVTTYSSMSAGILAGIILGAGLLKYCLCRKQRRYYPPGL